MSRSSTATAFRSSRTAAKCGEPNPLGLYNVHGNVWEWVEDCWQDHYEGAPADGRAWITGECKPRVLRGSARDKHWGDLRSAIRIGDTPVNRYSFSGFPLARTLSP